MNLVSAENVCNQFSNLIKYLKERRKDREGEKYPWLDKTDRENTCQIEKY